MQVTEHIHALRIPFKVPVSPEKMMERDVYSYILFGDKIGLWVMRQVWVKAVCDPRKLARAYLRHHNIKTAKKPLEVLREKYKIEVKEPKLIVMPAFNDLVGQASVNRSDRRPLGPMLSSGSVLMNDADLYLLDGTYIGKVKQVKADLGG